MGNYVYCLNKQIDHRKTQNFVGPDSSYKGLIHFIQLNKGPDNELVFFTEVDNSIEIYKWTIYNRIPIALVLNVIDINKDGV